MKHIVYLLFIFNVFPLQATEWYGLIPIQVRQSIPYFLLKIETSSENTDSPVLNESTEKRSIPPVGGYLPENITKDLFLDQKLEILNELLHLKLNLLKKLPYLSYHAESDTTDYRNCFGYGWNSDSMGISQTCYMSRKLIPGENISYTPFFGLPVGFTQQTPDSSKYKIYFIPLGNDINAKTDSTLQWFSITDIAAIVQKNPSGFLENLTRMFDDLDHGSTQKWEQAESMISQSIIKCLRHSSNENSTLLIK